MNAITKILLNNDIINGVQKEVYKLDFVKKEKWEVDF